MKAKAPGFQLDGQPLVACVVLLARDAERVLSLLRETLTASTDSNSQDPPSVLDVPSRTEPNDAWLNHVEAAQHLGISKSTLYKYTCQRKIQCRKFCGRLQYRRSALDRFKEEEVPPVKRSQPPERILKMALGSGK